MEVPDRPGHALLPYTQLGEPGGTGCKNVPPIAQCLGDVMGIQRQEIQFFGHTRFVNENHGGMKTGTSKMSRDYNVYSGPPG